MPSPETSDSEVEASPFVGRYTGGTGCLATQSLRQVDTVCGTHTYSLAGYTLARAMGPGTRLCSDLFEVGGQLFRLEVYPAGLDAAGHKYLGLFLTTPGSCRPGHLLYELSVIDKSTLKPVHITESRTAATPPPPAPATLQAPAPGVVAGFPRFVKSNFLHRNSRRFLHDDTLTIRATVKMLTGWSSFPVPPPAPQVFALHPTSPGALAAATAAAATGAVGGLPPALPTTAGGLTLIPPCAALAPQQTQTVLQLQSQQQQQLLYSGLQPAMSAAGAAYMLATVPPAQLQQAAGWTAGYPCPCPCSGGGASPAQHHGAYGSAGGAPALLYTQQQQQQPQQLQAAAGWQQGMSLLSHGGGGGGGGGLAGVGSAGGSGPPLTYGYGGAAALVPAQGTAPAVLQAGPGGHVTYGGGHTAIWQAPPVAVGTAPF
ncbi:hypothetical protein HYH02_013715 [Chlamydomonas schloesseri]|uniref:MATH domain-containing protein n=1 Tax=Chlamydomonas schloesseri TaxID=2026947 RepID=A0A835SR87_9CHLO|nr:hypothetical protein HYH02_013715 [Chlamydomonas schloesseri]|eukprot:KAG2430351.1 hypothetical protein HYH02_013715 [Chlamydomonas schloesseri]